MAVRRADEVELEPQSAAHVALPGPGERFVRLMRGMAVALAIAVFWLAAFALAWLVVPWVLFRERAPLARRRAMQRMVAAAWRWFLRTLERTSLYRARYVGGVLPSQPCVVIANHPSLLDVTALIAHSPHLCCVVKASLVDSPLVGRLLRSCGHVSAGDGSLMSGRTVLEALSERLTEGFSVLIFPEGTRSPPGGIHKLRRGAFEVAQRNEVPLVPIFLRCDPPALGKGTPVWLHPLRCPTLTVHIDAAISMNDRDPALVCREVRADFASRLAQPVSAEVKHELAF